VVISPKKRPSVVCARLNAIDRLEYYNHARIQCRSCSAVPTSAPKIFETSVHARTVGPEDFCSHKKDV